jgi:hypothetical protein
MSDAVIDAKYPEHAKLIAVAERSQVIGEFLEWLKGERLPRVWLCVSGEDEEGEDTFYPEYTSTEQMLSEYFHIDLEVIEKEKQAMLDELRRRNP